MSARTERERQWRAIVDSLAQLDEAVFELRRLTADELACIRSRAADLRELADKLEGKVAPPRRKKGHRNHGFSVGDGGDGGSGGEIRHVIHLSG